MQAGLDGKASVDDVESLGFDFGRMQTVFDALTADFSNISDLAASKPSYAELEDAMSTVVDALDDQIASRASTDDLASLSLVLDSLVESVSVTSDSWQNQAILLSEQIDSLSSDIATKASAAELSALALQIDSHGEQLQVAEDRITQSEGRISSLETQLAALQTAASSTADTGSGSDPGDAVMTIKVKDWQAMQDQLTQTRQALCAFAQQSVSGGGDTSQVTLPTYCVVTP